MVPFEITDDAVLSEKIETLKNDMIMTMPEYISL